MNKLYLSRLGYSIFLIIIGVISLQAQDIHFSQFQYSPMNLNPGLTGVFSGDMRFVNNFKPQWNSVPVSYLQVSSGIDARFINKDDNGPFAVGFFIDYDQAGDSQLSFLQLSLTGSYSVNFDRDRRNYLTIGGTFSGVQRSFDDYRLFFDTQYDGTQLRSELPSQEDFSNTKVFFADIAGGINLHLAAPLDRSTLDIGGGVFHIQEPDKAFFINNAPATVTLKRRYTGYAIGVKTINSHLDALGHGIVNFQGEYREYLFGLAARQFLIKRPTKIVTMDVGVSYRVKDAIIPYVGFHYNGWQVGVSYDINLSRFREASLGLGSFEISAIYIITDVPFATYCPHCPTFL